MNEFERFQKELADVRAQVAALEAAEKRNPSLKELGAKRVAVLNRKLESKPYTRIGDLPAKEVK